MDMINKSEAFAKFIEFDKYYDEDNDLIRNIHTQRPKQNYSNKEFREMNNIGIDSNNNIENIINNYKQIDIDDDLNE